MRRLFTSLLLAGLAVLNTACAEESGPAKTAADVIEKTSAPTQESTLSDKTDAPAETPILADKTDAPTQKPMVVAKNTNTPASNTTPSSAKETGTTRSAVELMATPYRDAKPAGNLPANATVEIIERSGGWLRISGQGKSGWVRLHQVRSGEGAQARSGGGLTVLKNVSQTGRSGSTGIVATTGIRGLSAEELKSAKPNPQEVGTLDKYRASDNSARDFAKSANLKEKSVPFLSQE